MLTKALHTPPPYPEFAFCSGQCYTRSKFLGNSAAAMMEGSGKVYLINRGEDYTISFPNASAAIATQHCRVGGMVRHALG